MQIYTNEQLRLMHYSTSDGVHAIGHKCLFVCVAASRPIASAVKYAVILAM